MADASDDPVSTGQEVDWTGTQRRPATGDGPTADRESRDRSETDQEQDGPSTGQEQDRRSEAERLEAERLDAEQQAELEEPAPEDEHQPGHPDVVDADRRARAAEESRDFHRDQAAAERWIGREDRGRAASLDAGAAGRDDPQADADRAAADRHRVSAAHQDGLARYDDRVADREADEAHHQSAQSANPSPTDGSQPPAAEAVRTPPPRAPRARRFLKSRRKSTKRERERRQGI